MESTVSYLKSGGSSLHQCNCVGCCRKCGGCVTYPKHALVCKDIARLNVERALIYEMAGR